MGARSLSSLVSAGLGLRLTMPKSAALTDRWPSGRYTFGLPLEVVCQSPVVTLFATNRAWNAAS